MSRSRVDLPAPFGPVTASSSPAPTAKERSAKTVRPPRTAESPVAVRRMGRPASRPGRGQRAPSRRNPACPRPPPPHDRLASPCEIHYKAGDPRRRLRNRFGMPHSPVVASGRFANRIKEYQDVATSLDSFKSRRTLTVGGATYEYYSLPDAEKNGLDGIARLPFSLKVLLENLLRHEDGRTVTADDIRAMAAWLTTRTSDREIAFRPARVLMQDFTGVPAVVDLAAMRDAMVTLGGDPARINPLVPVDLVIDHSVMVDQFGDALAFQRNVDREYERNGERYQFLRWGQSAFRNFRVVPPGTGICHQVNLEYLAQTVWTGIDDGTAVAYPDTLVGTDSHTTMVNGLAVLGWGVGGIEAEAAMLGQPISMLIPEVIGFRMNGRLTEGVTATDLVLTVTQMLRKQGRRRQVRRVLRRRPLHPVAGRPGDHRQHGAGIWRHLRLLPGRQGYARLSQGDRPRPRPHRAGRSLCPGAGHVPPGRDARSGVHRHPVARSGQRRPVDRRAKASAGPRRAGPRRYRLRGGARRLPRRQQERRRLRHGRGRRRLGAGALSLGQGRRQGLQAHRRRRRHRRHHLVHQHLQSERAHRRRPGGPQRPRERADRQAVGEDFAGARLAGGDRVSRQGRPAGAPRRARLQPRRLRLHHLHRQLRPAVGGDFRGHRRQGAGRRLGAVRQPQLRGPRQSRYARQLPRLAAAGGHLCADRQHARQRHQRPARHRHGRHAGLSQGHLADHQGGGRSDPHRGQRGHVPRALCRRLQGRRAVAQDLGHRRPDLRLVGRLDLRAEPALFRGHHHDAGAGRGHRRGARARASCSIPSPPTTSRRQARSSATAPPANISFRIRCGRWNSTPTARAAATIR